MVFKRYTDVELFKADVLDVLLEDEVQNNLPVSIILNSSKYNSDSWLLSVIKNDRGEIILVAVCTKPYNVLLYEPAEKRHVASMSLLADELRRIGFELPGVLARSDLAQRFKNAYCKGRGCMVKSSMVLMQLDELAEYKKAPGFSRLLSEDDLAYVPSWEHEFSIECKLLTNTPDEYKERIRTRLDKDTHFIWEDGQPVAQAVHGRDTPNCGVISWVYTPPQFRGRGYATSVVGELSESLMNKGKKYCCLFADAANPVSRGVYKKLGYYDVCEFDEIIFDIV